MSRHEVNGRRLLTAVILVVIPVILAGLPTGALWVDARYAKAADVQSLKADVLAIRIEQQRALRAVIGQHLWLLEAAKAQRKLTPIEAQRERELQQEMTDVAARLGALERARGTP